MNDKSTLDPQRETDPLDGPEPGDASASEAIHQLLHARSVVAMRAMVDYARFQARRRERAHQ